MKKHPARYLVRTVVVSGCLAVALVGLLGYRIARAQVAFCKNAPGSGMFAYTLSLPRSSPIANSSQLLASIPGAIAVNKLDRATASYWRDDGSGFCARCFSPPFVTGVSCTLGGEPGASPYCFIVNPGEGFVVVSNAPAQYPIPGVDTPTVVLSLPTGLNLISIPYDTTASDAKSLMDDVGFPNVENVQRYVATTDTFQVYTGRKGSGPDWPIVAGDAYLVKMTTSTNYVPSHYGVPSFVCSTSPSTYSINGSANTNNFSFALLDGTGAVKCWSNCASLTNGGNASQVATDLKAGVNAACSGIASATSSANSVTITTLSGPSVQDLKVGTSDCANTTTPVASCQVAFSGSCTFNPTVIFSCGPDGSTCDDGNACSMNDTCVNGTCSGTCYCAARPPGMVGWWPADVDANDSSGGGHPGNLSNGASIAGGQVSGAFSFDGTNDLVQVPGYLNAAPTNEVTVLFWQKVSSVKIQSTFSASGFVNGSVFNAHVPYNDGNVYWDFGNISTGGRLMYTPPTSLTGTWQHFALVATQSGNAMRIYRNGVKEAEKAGMTPFIRANLDLDIGGTAGISFGGLVDEFTIFDRALTDHEIKVIYDAGAQGVCKQCTDTDGDGYGVAGNVCAGGPVEDCAPGNPSLWARAGSTGLLAPMKTAQPGTINWSWSPASGGTSLAVVYDFGRRGGGLPDECVLHGSAATNVTESAIPSPGTFCVFSLRANDTCGGGAALPMCP